MNLRLALTVPRPRPSFSAAVAAPVGKPGSREVWFPAGGYVRSPVYDRSQLVPGMAFDGPAIVEQMDTTTVIPPSARCRIDDSGNLHIMLGEAKS